MQIIIDRILTDVQVSSKHIVIIACIASGIATAISSYSHHIDEQKQSHWKKISKIVTDL